MEIMIPSYYEFFNPVKIISGSHALENLPHELGLFGVKRPLLVTDEGIKNAGLLNYVKKSFNETEISFILYDKVPQDSSEKVVKDLFNIFNSARCDSIIALGGGSVIDTAKALNILLSTNSDDLMQSEGSDILGNSMKTLIAIPTTVGTGSEGTGVAVVKDYQKNVKIAFSSQFLIPKVAILDPRMSTTLPRHILAATAMDAMTHAIESFICLQKNPVSDAFAWAALKILGENLLAAVNNPKHKKYRFALANAACLAGIGLSNSIAGIVHCLGHAVGGVCGIPHGGAMNIILPYGLEYNLTKVEEYIAELLFPLTGADIYCNTPVENRAKKTIDYIREIRDELFSLTKLPRTLKEAGVPKDKLKDIARTAINDGSVAYNPEEIEYSDALFVLKQAYE